LDEDPHQEATEPRTKSHPFLQLKRAKRLVAIKYSCIIDRELVMYCYNSKVCTVPMHKGREECSTKCMGFIY